MLLYAGLRWIEETWIITPKPCLIIPCSKPRSKRTAANRFMFSSFCHSSSLKAAKPPLGAEDAPTTLTRMSMPSPKREVTSLTIFVHPAAVLRSAWINTGSRSLWRSPLVGLRAVVITLAPPSRSRIATALPIPAVPPVTRTRFPLNSFAINGNLVAMMILCWIMY